ncbi:MAG: hypothetical protein A3G24_14055 [Betaproteobacteria bacterium RIFCSPLOWO2_12_FULL_62_13]|nr:MAG: hypothetical protein A3G24_14055 [Betaproteobacteria bacterium RIFCSPLOWO2_12_FULL_62_13]
MAARVHPQHVRSAHQLTHHLLAESDGSDTALLAAVLSRAKVDLAPGCRAIQPTRHWGSSMSPHVHDFQREIGTAAIDAGAHAVFGGHQHVVSAIEFYKRCPIVHCSGNLLFDKWEPFFNEETLKTFLFGATVDADGLRD